MQLFGVHQFQRLFVTFARHCFLSQCAWAVRPFRGCYLGLRVRLRLRETAEAAIPLLIVILIFILISFFVRRRPRCPCSGRCPRRRGRRLLHSPRSNLSSSTSRCPSPVSSSLCLLFPCSASWIPRRCQPPFSAARMPGVIW